MEQIQKSKEQYISSVPLGTIVAFQLGDKVKSAKIIKRSSKNRLLKLETKYGANYVASYDDVLWVKTGKRWPSGIYRKLKGLKGLDEENGGQDS